MKLYTEYAPYRLQPERRRYHAGLLRGLVFRDNEAHIEVEALTHALRTLWGDQLPQAVFLARYDPQTWCVNWSRRALGIAEWRRQLGDNFTWQQYRFDTDELTPVPYADAFARCTEIAALGGLCPCTKSTSYGPAASWSACAQLNTKELISLLPHRMYTEHPAVLCGFNYVTPAYADPGTSHPRVLPFSEAYAAVHEYTYLERRAEYRARSVVAAQNRKMRKAKCGGCAFACVGDGLRACEGPPSYADLRAMNDRWMYPTMYIDGFTASQQNLIMSGTLSRGYPAWRSAPGAFGRHSQSRRVRIGSFTFKGTLTLYSYLGRHTVTSWDRLVEIVPDLAVYTDTFVEPLTPNAERFYLLARHLPPIETNNYGQYYTRPVAAIRVSDTYGYVEYENTSKKSMSVDLTDAYGIEAAIYMQYRSRAEGHAVRRW